MSTGLTIRIIRKNDHIDLINFADIYISKPQEKGIDLTQFSFSHQYKNDVKSPDDLKNAYKTESFEDIEDLIFYCLKVIKTRKYHYREITFWGYKNSHRFHREIKVSNTDEMADDLFNQCENLLRLYFDNEAALKEEEDDEEVFEMSKSVQDLKDVENISDMSVNKRKKKGLSSIFGRKKK